MTSLVVVFVCHRLRETNMIPPPTTSLFKNERLPTPSLIDLSLPASSFLSPRKLEGEEVHDFKLASDLG